MAKQPPKKQRAVVLTEPAPEELSEADYIPPDLEFIEKRDELQGEGGGEINVYREGPGGYRDLTFIKSFALGEFQPALLQAPPFSGGRFRIHMRGRTGLAANFLFKVEPLPGAPGAMPGNAPGGVNLTLQQPAGDMAALVAAMQAGFTKLGELIVASANQRPATPPITMKEILDFGATIASRVAVPAGPNALDMVGKITPLLELVDRMRGDGGDGEGRGSIVGAFGRALDKLADSFAPVIGEVVKQRMQGGGAALPAPAAAPANPEGAVMANFDGLLKQYASVIMAAARTDADPASYAQMALDNGDPEQIAEFLKRPDWFDVIARNIPEAIHVRAWFEEFHKVLSDALTAPANDGKVIDADKGAVDAKPAGTN
jgi:hypothetical protein